MSLSVSPLCNEGCLGGCLLQIHSVHTDSKGRVFLVDDFGLQCDREPIAVQHRSPAERRLLREARAATGRDIEAERRRQEEGGRPPSARSVADD